jgi:FkbM family methyltransferase
VRVARRILTRDTGAAADCAIYGIATVGQILAPIARYPRLYHRIFWRARKWLGRAVCAGNPWCVVALGEDAAMKICVGDPYWSGLLAKSFQYEPEFLRVLSAFDDLDFTFIDCGANFGYWSILVSSTLFRSRPTLAIEAARNTYTSLVDNCAINGCRFACLHAAVSKSSGEIVCIDTSQGHSNSHVIRDLGLSQDAGASVCTVTLADAIRNQFGHIPERLVVKLDVEGEEINVFTNAKELVARDTLFFYEDHGMDPSCKVTRFVLEDLGMNVYFCHPDGRVVRIPTVASAAHVKKWRANGYNFFACKRAEQFDMRLTELVNRK